MQSSIISFGNISDRATLYLSKLVMKISWEISSQKNSVVLNFLGCKRSSWDGKSMVVLSRGSMAGMDLIAGNLPGTLPMYSIFFVLYRQYSTRKYFLLEVMCKGSSVRWGTNQLRRFLCSVRNKPRFLSLSFFMSLHVVTIPIPHVLTIPLFLHEPTCSHDPSPHSLRQKHREFYMSLHSLTLSLMFTRAS